MEDGGPCTLQSRMLAIIGLSALESNDVAETLDNLNQKRI
jgi:hypothetical protein